MDKATKAKINKVVRKIKASRAESKAQADIPETADFPYQVGSKAEKVMIGLGLAAGLAILTGGSNKKKKRSYTGRVRKYYGWLGGLLDSTVSKQLKLDSEREFTDEALERLKIEDAIKFDI
ncbi:MAG: hypothetical protein IJ723_08100 [Ruminococcus sp.]|nr:hypothetical protein [Ruminococcus sp.]